MPVLTGAAIVLRDDIVRGDLHIEDGLIAAIGERPAGAALVDCSGCYILPGLVDLHTDNVERHVEPRPGTFWPPPHAVMAHDAELASAGITTAFDAITLGGGFAEERRQAASFQVIEALAAARRAALLRIDHRLHLRCELSDAALPDIIAKVADPSPQIVSLMNHTPGQRQWRDLEKFRGHYARRYGLSEAELTALIATRQRNETTIVPANRRHTIDLARRTGAHLASHDDSDMRDVDEAAASWCILSEFPTTAVAAAHASARGLAVVAGAPNLVCGASHSGNVSAAALASNGHVDILSSDYCPSSLLQAAFLLHNDFGWSLAMAVRTVSSTPAQLMGLSDRGEVAVGRRADVMVAQQTDLGFVIRETWAHGRRVF